MVAPGLKVTATKDADLACSAEAPAPSITVAEGFTGAWSPGPFAAITYIQHPSVKIVLDNLPDDAKVEWPASVNSTINVAPSGEDEDLQVNGTLTLDAARVEQQRQGGRLQLTRVNSYKVDDPRRYRSFRWHRPDRPGLWS